MRHGSFFFVSSKKNVSLWCRASLHLLRNSSLCAVNHFSSFQITKFIPVMRSFSLFAKERFSLCNGNSSLCDKEHVYLCYGILSNVLWNASRCAKEHFSRVMEHFSLSYGTLCSGSLLLVQENISPGMRNTSLPQGRTSSCDNKLFYMC